MPKTLDGLIAHVVDKIALKGQCGALPSDFIAAVRSYYAADDPDQQGQLQSVRVRTKPTIDQPFLEHVWTRLGRHPQVRLGSKDQAFDLTFAAAEALATENQGEATLGRDGVDETHVSPSTNTIFDYTSTTNANSQGPKSHVSQVAAKGPSNRSKKSPKKHQPSSITPKAFRVYASEHSVWQAIAGHGPDSQLVRPLDFIVLCIIAANGPKGIVQHEIVRLSGQDKRSLPHRTDRLHDDGYIEKERVTILVKGDIHERKLHTSLCTLKRFAQLPEHRSEVERLHREVNSRIHKRKKRIAKNAAARVASDDEASGGAKGDHSELDAQDEETSSSGSCSPQWLPDYPVANQIFRAVDSFGSRGATLPDIRQYLFGQDYKKPIEFWVTRMVDAWQISQPLYLRHLAIVRDTVLRAKSPVYIHYTFSNFEKLVEAGSASWDAVTTVAQNIKLSESVDASLASQPRTDDFGFPSIEPEAFEGIRNEASLAQCAGKSQVIPGTPKGKRYFVLKETSTPDSAKSQGSVAPNSRPPSALTPRPQPPPKVNTSQDSRPGKRRTHGTHDKKLLESAGVDQTPSKQPMKPRKAYGRPRKLVSFDVPDDINTKSHAELGQLRKTYANTEKYQLSKLVTQIDRHIPAGQHTSDEIERALEEVKPVFLEDGLASLFPRLKHLALHRYGYAPPPPETKLEQAINSLIGLPDKTKRPMERRQNRPPKIFWPSVAAHTFRYLEYIPKAHRDHPLAPAKLSYQQQRVEEHSDQLGVTTRKRKFTLPEALVQSHPEKVVKKPKQGVSNASRRWSRESTRQDNLNYYPSIAAHSNLFLSPMGIPPVDMPTGRPTKASETNEGRTASQPSPIEQPKLQPLNPTGNDVVSQVHSKGQVPRHMLSMFEAMERRYRQQFSELGNGPEGAYIARRGTFRRRYDEPYGAGGIMYRLAVFRLNKLRSTEWMKASVQWPSSARKPDGLLEAPRQDSDATAVEIVQPQNDRSDPTKLSRTIQQSPIPFDTSRPTVERNESNNQLSANLAIPTSDDFHTPVPPGHSANMSSRQLFSADRAHDTQLDSETMATPLISMEIEEEALLGSQTDRTFQERLVPCAQSIVNTAKVSDSNPRSSRGASIDARYHSGNQLDAAKPPHQAPTPSETTNDEGGNVDAPRANDKTPLPSRLSSGFRRSSSTRSPQAGDVSQGLDTGSTLAAELDKRVGQNTLSAGAAQGSAGPSASSPPVSSAVVEGHTRTANLMANASPGTRGRFTPKKDTGVQNTTAKTPGKIAVEPLQRTGGSTAMLRKSIVMQLVEKAGGVCPGYKELAVPFVIEWSRRGQPGEPENKTVRTVVNSLVSAGKLRQLNFAYRTPEGSIKTKVMLTLTDVDPNDARVKYVQMRMVNAGIRSYLPPEWLFEDEDDESEIVPEYVPWGQQSVGKSLNALQRFGHHQTLVKQRKDRERESTEKTEQQEQLGIIRALVKLNKRGQKAKARQERLEARKIQRRERLGETGRLDHLTGPQTSSQRSSRVAKRKTAFRRDPRTQLQGTYPYHAVQDPVSQTWRTASLPLPKLSRSKLKEQYGSQVVQPRRFHVQPLNSFRAVPQCKRPQTLPKTAQALQTDVGETSAVDGSTDEDSDASEEGVGEPKYVSVYSALKAHPRPLLSTVRHRITRAEQLRKKTALVKKGPFRVVVPSYMAPNQPFHNLSGTYATTFDGLIFTDNVSTSRNSNIKAYDTSDFLNRGSNTDKTVQETRSMQTKTLFESQVDQLARWERRFPNFEGVVYTKWTFIHHFFPIQHLSVTPEYVTLDDARIQEISQNSGRLVSKPANPYMSPRNHKAAQDLESQGLPIFGVKRLRSGSLSDEAAGISNDERPDKKYKSKRMSRKRHRRRGPAEIQHSTDQIEDYRLITAVIAVRCLSGGVEKRCNWGLVAQACAATGDRMLANRWRDLQDRYGRLIHKAEDDFQRLFLEAYEKGTMPGINFKDLKSFPWRWLVDWITQASKPPAVVETLPARRQALSIQDAVVETPDHDINRFYELDARVVKNARKENLYRHAWTEPTQDHLPHHEDKQDQLTVAKTWVRANIVASSSDNYDGMLARSALLKFPENIIEDALNSLASERVVALDMKRPKHQRMYVISEPTLAKLDRTIIATDLQRAVHFKAYLDLQISANGQLEWSPHAQNGDVIAILNLLAQEKITLHTKDVPLNPMGLLNGGYHTKAMDKTKLYCKSIIVPTAKYKEGSPLMPLPPPPSKHLAEAMNTKQKIPLWYDIHGNIAEELWERVLTAVMCIITTRPGVSLEELAKMTHPVLDLWEVELIVEWIVEAGAGRTWVSSGRKRYRTREWWWTVLGSEEEDGISFADDRLWPPVGGEEEVDDEQEA